MMKLTCMKNSRGFTTIELMVSMAILFSMVGLIYSIYLFSIKLSRNWREKIQVENAANICMKIISDDLIKAVEIEMVNHAFLIITISSEKQIIYKVKDYNLLRNGFILNPGSTKIFHFTCSTFNPKQPMDFTETPKKYFDQPKSGFEQTEDEYYLFKIDLELVSGNKRFRIGTIVRPRNFVLMAFRKGQR